MRNNKFVRTCKGCYTKVNKNENDLIQIGYNKNEQIFYINGINENSRETIKNSGKTMYLCDNENCLKMFFKKKGVFRFFGKTLTEESEKQLINEIILKSKNIKN